MRLQIHDRFVEVTPHPATGAILGEYPVGTIISLGEQPFIVGHRGAIGIVLVPLSNNEVDRLCGSGAKTTIVSPTN